MFVRSIAILFALLAGLFIAMPDSARAQSGCSSDGIKREEAKIDKARTTATRGKKQRLAEARRYLHLAEKALANNDFEACEEALKQAKNTRKRR